MANVRQETGRGFAANGITTATVTNSAAETVLFSQLIPAGAMGQQKRIEFYISCLLTTAAVAPSLTVRIKFGSSTLSIANGISLLALQTNKPFVISGKVKNITSGTQEIWSQIIKNTSGLIIGGVDMDAASWTVDTTQDQLFQITLQYGSALAGTTISVKDADIELS